MGGPPFEPGYDLWTFYRGPSLIGTFEKLDTTVTLYDL